VLALYPVEGPVRDDPVQPGGESGLRAKIRQLLPCADQGFLRHILGVVMVADNPQRHPVGQPAIPVNQFSVGVEIAFLSAPDKVGVINTSLHVRPPCRSAATPEA